MLLAATTLALWVDPASAGAAILGPATGRHPAHVEASIDHTLAEYGSPLVIAGAVDDPENPGTQPRNGEVELITRDGSGRHGRTIAVHHLQSGGHGGFTFDVSADRSTYYIVKYLGNSQLAPADSAPLQFSVQSLVAARADRTQVHRGEAISITADILPAVPGEGAWVVQLPPNENLANTRTDAHGHVVFRITAPDKPGSYDYAVACANYGPDDQTEGVSKYLHITVT